MLAYGEMLFAWQLPDKRAELLKLAEDDIGDLSLDIALTEATIYTAPIGEPYF